MKFNQNVLRTYGAVIALLLLLTVIVSYETHTIPINAIVAVPLAIAFNLCIMRFYLKSRIKPPYSAAITSLIITLVLPQSTSLAIIICAVLLAELSKFLMRMDGKNIFNPAAIGLIIPIALFNVGYAPWVNINSIYLSLPILFLLGVSLYSIKRMPASLAFGAVFVFLSVISIGLVKNFSVMWMAILLLSGYYTIAFIMLSDPKTSPKEAWQQCTYGAGIGFLTFIFSAIGLSFAFLPALLVGNLVYAVYKPARNRTAKSGTSAHSR